MSVIRTPNFKPALRERNTRYCCHRFIKRPSPRRINITGKQFGSWTVISFAHIRKYNNGNTVTVWKCVCICGKRKNVVGQTLRNGQSISCHCSQRKHGLAGSDIYNIWIHIKRRCNDPSYPTYHNYGGRGIMVCERWQRSVAAFASDMGKRPSKKHSVDRINNDGNYEPSNCRWATSRQQLANRRQKTDSNPF